MSGWLLDINVISQLRRPHPNARVRAFVAAQALEELLVSTVKFAEIRYGIEAVGDPIRRAELDDWLAHKLRPMFAQRVLEVSEDVMFKWRLLVEDGAQGRAHLFATRARHCSIHPPPRVDGRDSRRAPAGGARHRARPLRR